MGVWYNRNMSVIKHTKRTKQNVKRFNFTRKVKSPARFWRGLTNIVASVGLRGHKLTVNKHGMEGLKPPYFVIGTHHSYLDLKTMVKALNPHKVTYVCSLDALTMHSEWLMNKVGVIFKRKFIQDVQMLKNMKHSVEKLTDCVLVMYPEAKYSLDGTTSFFPDSLGKLAKYLGVPVVVANQHGNTVAQQQWSRRKNEKEPKRRTHTPLVVDISLVASADEVKTLKGDEIQERIERAMQYDDFAWQKANNVVIDTPDRAEGLHKLLYKCPRCGVEFQTDSGGTRLWCKHCGAAWEMTPLGELQAADGGEPIYTHIPDWFDFEQASVRKEIESGTYRFEADVHLCTLPYNRLFEQGTAHFVQTPEGITLTGTAYGEPFAETWKGNATNGLHIEYNYSKESDAFALSTVNETYWCFMPNNGIITKLSLANDEIYRISSSPAEIHVVANTPEEKEELKAVLAAACDD